jgi:CBS domain-containing protein
VPKGDRVLSVEALMKRDLVSVAPDASVADAARRMRDAKVGAVLVLEEGRVAGILSERDVTHRVVAAGRSPDSTKVGEVASRPVVTVEAGTSLRACAERLRDEGVRHVPVLSGGKPVGILSARDFFAAVAGGLEAWIERARYDEKLRENVDPYDHMGGSYGR